MTPGTPVLRTAQRLFLWAGVCLLVVAGGSTAYAALFQRYQSWAFDRHAGAGRSVTAIAPEPAPSIRDGEVVGRLEVARIGISVMILQGTDAATLAVGAGHVPGTPLPGGDGNVAIAGHRDTYFRALEGVRPGDDIRIATVHETYAYVVDSTDIVDPEDTRPMTSRTRPELTLITCYPFHFVGSAPRRFIVHAHPVK